MRKFAAVLLPALILVAGCKGQAPNAPASSDAAPLPSLAAPTMPTVPADARQVALAGTYSHTGADGKAATLKLGAGNTYEWTDGSGKTVTGKYAWYEDHRRILLTGAANKAVFAVADGALYQMAGKDAAIGTMTADQLWNKSPTM